MKTRKVVKERQRPEFLLEQALPGNTGDGAPEGLTESVSVRGRGVRDLSDLVYLVRDPR